MKLFTYTFCIAILFSVTFSNPGLQNKASGGLCSACKFLFEEIKKVVPTVNNDTDRELKKTIKEKCDKLLGKYPLIDKVCDQVLTDVLEAEVEEIAKLDREINPDKICEKLHMCSH